GIIVSAATVGAGEGGAAILNAATMDVHQAFSTDIVVPIGPSPVTSFGITASAIGILVSKDSTLGGVVENTGDIDVSQSNHAALLINALNAAGDARVTAALILNANAAGARVSNALLPGFSQSGSLRVSSVGDVEVTGSAISPNDSAVYQAK